MPDVNLFKRKMYRKERVQVLEDSRVTCASDEIFVCSYESLLPASDGKLLILILSAE